MRNNIIGNRHIRFVNEAHNKLQIPNHTFGQNNFNLKRVLFLPCVRIIDIQVDLEIRHFRNMVRIHSPDSYL